MLLAAKVVTAVAGTAVGLTVMGVSHHVAPVTRNHPVAHVVARQAACPATKPGKQSGGTVAVSIPALTMIRLSPNGRVASVTTNAGHQPCPGDQFYVLGAGHARKATAAERTAALHNN